MKEIICKNGEVALCDDEDYPLLSRFTWYMGSELKSGGYPCCFIYGQHNTRKQVFMHQLVMPSAVFVDHEDRNKMNNQKVNLRPATWQQNQWNKVKPKSGRFGVPTSQYKGVRRVKRKSGDKWLASLKHVEEGKHKSTGHMIYIGYFDTEIDAAKAYNEKVRELRGEWAWVNPLPQSGLV